MKKIEDITSNNISVKELLLKKIVLKEDEFTDKEKVRQLILTNIEMSRKRSRKRIWMAAASIMLVMMTTAAYFTSNKEFASSQSILAISLPDGSTVQMQKGARLSYNRIAWLWNRRVDFSGDAYFTVAKGERFTVNTNYGSIAVLGTEFQVQTEGQTLAVECFSGSVSVKAKTEQQMLQQGEKVTCSPSGMIFVPAAEPLPDFLEFNNAPLSDVISQIEMLYHVTIVPKDIYAGIIYDGILPTGNLNEALEIVFSSCGMTATIDGNQIEISSYAN